MNVADGSKMQRITFEAGFDGRCDWQRVCTVTGAGDITGTPDDDVICGSPDNDRIAGLEGHDIVYGFAGDDQLSGGDDNDTLFGGLGNDSLFAGPESISPPQDRATTASSPSRRSGVDVGAGAVHAVSAGRLSARRAFPEA